MGFMTTGGKSKFPSPPVIMFALAVGFLGFRAVLQHRRSMDDGQQDDGNASRSTSTDAENKDVNTSEKDFCGNGSSPTVTKRATLHSTTPFINTPAPDHETERDIVDLLQSPMVSMALSLDDDDSIQNLSAKFQGSFEVNSQGHVTSQGGCESPVPIHEVFADQLQIEELCIPVMSGDEAVENVRTTLEEFLQTQDLSEEPDTRSLAEEMLSSIRSQSQNGLGAPFVERLHDLVDYLDRSTGDGQEQRMQTLLSLMYSLLPIAESFATTDHFIQVLLTVGRFHMSCQEEAYKYKGLEYLQTAFNRSDASFGRVDPVTVESLVALGLAFADIGDHDRAMDILAQDASEAALELFQSDADQYSELYKGVGVAMNNLAVAMRQMKRLEDAEFLITHVLNVDISVHGNDDPEVAGDLRNLAQVLMDQANRSEDAINALKGAMTIFKNLSTSETAEVKVQMVGCLDDLTTVYFSCKRLSDAKTACSKAIGLLQSLGDLIDVVELQEMQNRLETIELKIRRTKPAYVMTKSIKSAMASAPKLMRRGSNENKSSQ